jgi:hypothetical protein
MPIEPDIVAEQYEKFMAAHGRPYLSWMKEPSRLLFKNPLRDKRCAHFIVRQ